MPDAKPPKNEIDLFSAAFATSPQEKYATARKACPVSLIRGLGTPAVTRFDDVVEGLRQPELFSSAMEEQMALGTERPMIPQQIDPPLQTKFRRLLDPCFSRKRMAALEPRIRRHARELVEQLAGRGECDFNPAFAVPLPCNAFLHLMGLPEEELDVFLRLKDGILRPQNQVGTASLEAMKDHRAVVGREIYAYFEDVIAQRRGNPGDDMISFLLATEIDGERLTDHDILDVSFLLILAGLDTVTATLGCAIAYLARNPRQRQRIVEKPECIPDAVEELLRFETPVTAVPRLCTRKTEIGGIAVEEGDLVTFVIGSANTDESEFPESLRVDFDRTDNRHIAFGAGPHRCLGSHLARMELRVALEEWHRRIPDYQIQPGETPLYSPGIREVQYLPLSWEVGE